MKKRCAGLVALLLLLGAIGIGNAEMYFGGVIDPRTTATLIDSVMLTSPDMTFLTPGWGSHPPRDTFTFTGVTAWPASLVLYGTVNGFPANTTIPDPKADTWYRIGTGVFAPQVEFGYYPGVEESKPAVERLQCLSVSPSVVTGQMTVRLQTVETSRPVVRIHDAAGNVVRSLGCTAGASGAATATWNREDEFGQLVPEGVYFCRYAAAGVVAVRKVLVAH
jgi:hypothetical protein